MKKLLTILLCLTHSALFGQKYDYIWMSGAYISSDSSSSDFAIDFVTTPPSVYLIDDSLTMGHSSIAISDYEGFLQFYTNGCIIRSKNNTTMDGADFINLGPGDPSWDIYCGLNGYNFYPVFQGIFVLPFDNSISEIFHLQFDPFPELYYCQNNVFLTTRVNTNANQGLGEVIFQDSVLVQGCFQTACANRHANGRDWWILLPDNFSNRFYRFLSTPDGIQGPWVQEIENPTVDTVYVWGWNEFSPDGTLLQISDIFNGTAIYDFDRCTGLLSNLRYIPAETDLVGYGYTATFSPDSRFIYVVSSSSRKMEQYDLHASDIIDSRTTVAIWDGFYDFFHPNGLLFEASFSFFQHGPDGKLYNWAGGTRFMHSMDFPNRKGVSCNVRQRAISLPYYTFGANAYYPHYRLGPIDGSSCDTLGIDNLPVALFRYDLEDTLNPQQVTFTDVSSYEPTSWHWTFGDGQTSQDTNPVHTYAQGGVYEVCLEVSNAFAADTFCRQVQVGATGVHTLPALPHARVWPNPFSSTLNIQLPALVGVSPEFVLYDLYGRVVKAARLTDFDNQIPAQDLPSGLYVWQLRWNGEVTQTGKVVKNDGR
ncbi:MAG: PKD domain-containing protein [Chitinophagales bacterium]|nr:PKD domain-containing protein [Chitinophagales bacterium]